MSVFTEDSNETEDADELIPVQNDDEVETDRCSAQESMVEYKTGVQHFALSFYTYMSDIM